MTKLHPELERMETADPKADLDVAIAANDFRFVGVYGIGFWCPEADHRDKVYGTKGINGTSDFSVNDRHFDLNCKASRYARAYNKLLINELDRRGM